MRLSRLRFSSAMLTESPSARDASARWRDASNPFASRFVNPSAMRFRNSSVGPNWDPKALARSMRERLGSTMLIVGPHGSGKTTLLRSALPELEANFKSVRSLTIQSGISTWALVRELSCCPRKSLFLIDGAEQLSRWQQTIVLLACRTNGLVCLATAHEPLSGFETAVRTETSLELARELTKELLSGQPDLIVPGLSEIDRLWPKCDDNLRELWSAMYDWYQENYRVA